MNMTSPLKGTIKKLEEVNDIAFSQKLIGEGVAVIPEETIVCSPLNGVVNMIFPTKHAIGLTSDDGIEVLIHIGIDTVEFNGSVFELFTKENQVVEKGTKLVRCDFNVIESRGYETDVVVLVTDKKQYDRIEVTKEGQVDKGETILEIK